MNRKEKLIKKELDKHFLEQEVSELMWLYTAIKNNPKTFKKTKKEILKYKKNNEIVSYIDGKGYTRKQTQKRWKQVKKVMKKIFKGEYNEK